MSYFIVLIFILLFGVDLSYLFKRGFGQTAAFTNFVLIFMLYLGGLFADMRSAMYAFMALAILLTCFVGYRVVKNKDLNGIKTVVANPAFYLYALLGLALGVACIKLIPLATDEMTHWGLVVKNMYAYNNFGNIGNTTTMFNQYVPATGIFMYAFQIFNTQFSCGTLYCAFDLLIISMLLPVMEMFEKKLSIPCIISMLVAFGICMLFKTNMFSNLLVDGILGVMTAYIFLAYAVDRDDLDGFTVVNVAFAVFVITMTKSSGIALAIFALIFIAIDMFTVGRKSAKEFFKDRRNIAYALLPIVLIVFAKTSWSWYADFYDVRAGWDVSEMTMSNILEWFKSPNEYQSNVTSLFFKTFFVGTIKYDGGLQLPGVFIFLLLVIASIVLWLKTRNKAYSITYGVISWIIIFGYGISLLLLYVFSFAYWEGLTLASYARYSMTILLAIALIYLYRFIELFAVPLSEKDILPQKVSLKLKPVAYPIYLVTVGVVSLAIAVGGYFSSLSKANKANEPYTAWTSAVNSIDFDNSVYIVISDEDGLWPQALQYIKMRFMATPVYTSGYLEGGSYTEGRSAEVCYTGNPFSSNMSVEELTEEMSKYTHVYLHDVWDGFIDKYSDIFEDEIKDGTLYKITTVDGKFKLMFA